MSFTTGSLFHQESVHLAAIYLELCDWKAVRDRVVEHNLLQTRTLNTLKRTCREIISRLKLLSSNEINFLVEASHQDQGYLLWLAICRRYEFIADFAVEVVRERYVSLKWDLKHEDFDTFFSRKTEWHEELDIIASTTRSKLRQVLFKMLQEADLLSSNNNIIAATPSPRLLETIKLGSGKEVFYFPAFDADLGKMMA